MGDVRPPVAITAGKRSLSRLLQELTEEQAEADAIIGKQLTDVDETELSCMIIVLNELLERAQSCLEDLVTNVDEWDVKTKEQRAAKTSIEDEVTDWHDNLENGFSRLRKLKKLRRKVDGGKNDVSFNGLDDIEKILTAQSQNQLATQELLDKLAQGSSKTTNKQQFAKLPSLSLPSFDGNPIQFQEFWDTFNATVHKNPNIESVQKFGYLKDKLKGKALETIQGLRVCDTNYSIARAMIMERFGNKQTIVNAHYTALMDLPSCSSQVASIRSFIDKVEMHLHSLEAQDEDVEQNVFIPVILNKLPSDIKFQLELMKAGETWEINQLRSALGILVKAKEDTNPHHESQHSTSGSFATGHSLLAGTQTKMKCVYCTSMHYSDECPKYKTLEARKEQLGAKCYRCLKTGHGARNCQNARTCYHCKRNSHHRSLCPEKFKSNATPSSQSSKVSYQNGKTGHAMNTHAQECKPGNEHAMISPTRGNNVLLQTAVTDALNEDNTRKRTVRILFDTGSTRSYVTENVQKDLGLEPTGSHKLALATFGASNRSVKDYPMVKLYLNQRNGTTSQIEANVINTISCPLQKTPLSASKRESLQKLCLAEPLCDAPNTMPIDILIGADQYFQFVGCERLEYPDGLLLIDSTLGFLMAGKIRSKADHSLVCHDALSLAATDISAPPEFDLERFWNLESIGIQEKELKTEDDTALESFKENVRFVNGRYFVSWPWKEEDHEVPENRQLAEGRLKSLLKRLPNEVLSTYNDTIQQQLESGVIEPVDMTKEPDGVVHYIPHHCVIKSNSESTKLRIVYDASAKTTKQSQSLNDSLYRGPVMLPDLCGILLRFRMSPVAISSDVEKAFLQIGLNQPDRDCTRFLWVADHTKPPIGDNVITYRFCRVPFGVVASPFLLSATIAHHLSETQPSTAEEVTRNIYVDNVLGGALDTKDAQRYYTDQKQVFSEASMNLRQWASNDKEFIASLPEADQVKGKCTKILGMNWDTNNDLIWVPSPRAFTEIETKRQFLQCISSIFDPMGMIGPVTVEAKIILQELWKRKFAWDEPLPHDVRKECQELCESLSAISDVKLPRFVGTRNCDGSSPKYELHVFTDASANAYGASAYLRTICGEQVSVDLLFSKSRIAPTKPTSIPRLELFAVVLGTKMVKFLREQVPFVFSETYVWSDSKCALAWVTGTPTRPKFIERRIKAIHSVQNVKFGHVSGKDNPADLISRGSNVCSLKQNVLWWEGPTWLKSNTYPESEYPATKCETVEEDELPIEPALVSNETKGIIGLDKFSSLSKLVRVNAWVQRFVTKIRRKKSGNGKNLTAEELNESRLDLIRIHQMEQFGNEIKAIQRNKSNQLVNALGLFLDNGLLRCKGRLEYSHLPYESKYPLLLAFGSKLAKLIIMEKHVQLKHSGVSQVLAELRRDHWVPKGRAMVKRVINGCKLCKRYQGKPFPTPNFAPLPKERIIPGRAFESIGLDYFGPMYVKTDSDTVKHWVCLFTCLKTRAIHLEVVENMSAEHFLMAFRRFISRRGTPLYILSDNAKQFKLAKNVLDLLWEEIIESDDVVQFVAKHNIKWKFITELAPWMGGVYERMVGTVKCGLRKSMGATHLNACQLTTLLMEIEAIVNSRPLLYIGDEFTLENILTPARFLTGQGSIGTPNFGESNGEDRDYLQTPSNKLLLADLWKKQQECLKHFWNKWTQDYLQSLRIQHGQGNDRNVKPKVNEVVIIKDPDLPRCSWKLGIITEVQLSDDGEIRTVKLKLPSGRQLTRPVGLIYPMECDLVQHTDNGIQNKDATATQQVQIAQRPRRDAAAAATLRNRDIALDVHA